MPSGLVLVALLGMSSAALAAGEDGMPPPPPTEHAPPPARPTPPDRRSWHPTIAFYFAAEQPLGTAEAMYTQFAHLPFGPAAGLEITLPFARSWGASVWGYKAQFTGGTINCPICSARTTAFGASLDYFLLDGMNLDPWLSMGVGYRIFNYDHADITGITLNYTGIVAPRVAFGADYYFGGVVGFGFFTGVSFGEYFGRDMGGILPNNYEVHGFFDAGVRLVTRPFLTTK